MSKYIGDVSAYAYAVSKGYTGTEEEFAELMADYADVGQRAEDAAESALNSKTAAQTAAQTATTKASEASTSATSASGSASAASASASAASGSATQAAASATSASGSATAAAGSATTASTKASEASASATDAATAKTGAEAAQTAAETAQGKAEDAQEAAEDAAESVSASAAQIATNTADITQLKSEVSQKANVDGAYPDLTAGNAEQLVSTVYEEDSVPYIFRTAGGSMDIGDREEDMLVGGTVAWNQLVKNGDFATTDGWIAASGTRAVSDNELTYTIGTIGDSYYTNQIYINHTTDYAINIPTNHVVYLSCETFAPYSNGFYMSVRTNGVGQLGVGISNKSVTPNVWNRFDKVTKVTSFFTDTAFYWSISEGNYQVGDQTKLRNVRIIDLTQMFGSTIADYVYGLEQANAGAGVAWFKKLFPADYYPYDAGTLKFVEGVSSHDMVGFNQWDEEWESGRYNPSTGIKETFTTTIRSKNYIPIVPNTSYYCYIGSATVQRVNFCYYDANKNFISFASGITNPKITPSNAYYMTLYVDATYGTTYKHDICINLSWDGERNGEYEPYVKHSYPLDSDVTLRGIPKLDSANNLYYDGDTYESDGTVERRYGIVDLGTLGDWIEYSGYPGLFYLNTVPSGAKIPANNTGLPSLIANGYIAGISRDIGTSGHTKGEIALEQNRIYISNDTYTGNVSGFRTAISGVMLVYELATPTTETAEPYQNPQIVDDFGTEEYVTTSIVPVGHVTKYQPNLRAKLEMSPDSPDGDGDYIVRQSNGENSYVSLASTATIQDILARLTALEGNTNES